MKDMYMDALSGKFTDFQDKLTNIIEDKFENHPRIAEFKNNMDRSTQLKSAFNDINNKFAR